MVIFTNLPSDEEIETFENVVLQLAYRYVTRDLIREALQGSAPYNAGGNKILALAGDTILRQILINQGREKNKSAGEIQDVISHVASNDNLWHRGIAVGLNPFIIKHPGQRDTIAGKNLMASTMEAILGAVYYDSNRSLNDCETVMAALGLCWPE